MDHARRIGGTTMFYNNKAHELGLDIYGGDLLVIPSVYFKVINEAKRDLDDDSFKMLIGGLVESGLQKVLLDGDKGKNNWPSTESVLTDSDTSDHDTDHLFFCVHLQGNTSVDWMHMHIFQSADWRSHDDLWNEHNTCTKLRKPAAGWNSLSMISHHVDDQHVQDVVEQLATCLVANYGDGTAGDVAGFDTCGQDNSSSSVSATTQAPASSS